ncbi:hypothetical protein DFJ74DRAFT_697134 [Hyaloraphidium curvatum]|nr:hypothetical protein DFJ74DRAFT_697134 [Hyaloraphidium curvatum]
MAGDKPLLEDWDEGSPGGSSTATLVPSEAGTPRPASAAASPPGTASEPPASQGDLPFYKPATGARLSPAEAVVAAIAAAGHQPRTGMYPMADGPAPNRVQSMGPPTRVASLADSGADAMGMSAVAAQTSVVGAAPAGTAMPQAGSAAVATPAARAVRASTSTARASTSGAQRAAPPPLRITGTSHSSPTSPTPSSRTTNPVIPPELELAMRAIGATPSIDFNSTASTVLSRRATRHADGRPGALELGTVTGTRGGSYAAGAPSGLGCGTSGTGQGSGSRT